VAGAFFMELLDSTVITTAMPQMAHSFHTLPIRLSSGVSAYMLALAVFIPLSGWLADRFGPRQVFGAAIAIFSLASLLCSLSQSLWFFTAARLLQGFGGAMMVPVGRLVVLRVTPKERLVHVIATLTWPALGAPVLGPPLGGFITMHWGWRWIFLLNLPCGLIGVVLTALLVSGEAGGRRPFDITGFLLSGIGCCTLMYACDLASQVPFAVRQVGVVGVVSFALLVAAWRHLRRSAHPLVPLDAFGIPTFAVAMGGGSLIRMAINSAPFLMPLMFQLAFGYDAATAGMLLLALFAGNLCMKPATTPLMRRWGFRRVLLVNGVLVALGFVLSMALNAHTPASVIMAVLFFTGLGRSMQFTALSTFSFCDVPPVHMSGASTLSSVLQQMSAGLGIAVSAIALRVAELWFPAPAGVLAADAFRFAFACMALLSLVGLIGLYRMPADAGALVSGATQNQA
jgi:EmrB/QacA subfamily drug resistance transporter